MDKNLTDSEIVKAYELCFAEKGTIQTCGKCPYHKFGKLCKVRRNRDALDLINRLQTEKNDLFYKLTGVMHSVDKWLDGDELKQDEVNRASAMREKTLQIVERLQAENERLESRIGVYETCNARKDEAIRGLETENKRLKKKVHKGHIAFQKRGAFYRKYIETAKAEAYKECIEKAKNEIDSQSHSRNLEASGERFRIHKILDNLLKELVGEKNA